MREEERVEPAPSALRDHARVQRFLETRNMRCRLHARAALPQGIYLHDSKEQGKRRKYDVKAGSPRPIVVFHSKVLSMRSSPAAVEHFQ